jgi:hypothetical protein
MQTGSLPAYVMLSLESIQQNVVFSVVLVIHVLLVFQVPPIFFNLNSIIYKMLSE